MESPACTRMAVLGIVLLSTSIVYISGIALYSGFPS